MIIFTVLGIIVAVFFFIVIIMSIIETRIKNRTKEKFLWNMDKVETRTGGLSHDRIYERNPDTGKIRSRKSGDYDNLVDEDCRMDEMEKRK